MSTPSLLVVDGNMRESRERLVAAGAQASGELYARTLRRLCPDAVVSILRPADGETLAEGVALADFHGIAFTGSALNVYHDTPPVRAQIDLMRDCFQARVPIFGSCWGLQVAAVAAGGVVRANPKGREFGIARKIVLNQAGLTHPMYRGKPLVFEATAIHTDEVATLPPGGRVLASNGMSQVQAAEIRWAGGEFWGVQYHPEFDIAEIGLYARCYAGALVKNGLFREDAEAEAFCLRCLQVKATRRRDLRQALGVDDDVLDDGLRLKELENWLARRVLPRV